MMVMPKHRVLKYFWPVLYAASYPISISMAESAKCHLHTLLKGEKGAFRQNWRGKVLENAGYFSTGEGSRRLWDHKLEVTSVH